MTVVFGAVAAYFASYTVSPITLWVGKAVSIFNTKAFARFITTIEGLVAGGSFSARDYSSQFSLLRTIINTTPLAEGRLNTNAIINHYNGGNSSINKALNSKPPVAHYCFLW